MTDKFERQLGKQFISMRPWGGDGYTANGDFVAAQLDAEEARRDAEEDAALERVFGPLPSEADAARVAGERGRVEAGAVAAKARADASGGFKADHEKPRMELLPPKAIEVVAKVLGAGARKYSADNWRKVTNGRSRYVAAALRHVFSRLGGEKLDSETGLPHLAHAACSLLFALELDGE